jgi:hypothetical protein
MDSDSTKRTLIDQSSSERKIGSINTAERQVKSVVLLTRSSSPSPALRGRVLIGCVRRGSLRGWSAIRTLA